VFEDLGPVASKSRALSDGLSGRAFLAALNTSTAEERQRLVEGLSKGPGMHALAGPNMFTGPTIALGVILKRGTLTICSSDR
jgi:hypothetical protein